MFIQYERISTRVPSWVTCVNQVHTICASTIDRPSSPSTEPLHTVCSDHGRPTSSSTKSLPRHSPVSAGQLANIQYEDDSREVLLDILTLLYNMKNPNRSRRLHLGAFIQYEPRPSTETRWDTSSCTTKSIEQGNAYSMNTVRCSTSSANVCIIRRDYEVGDTARPAYNMNIRGRHGVPPLSEMEHTV